LDSLIYALEINQTKIMKTTRTRWIVISGVLAVVLIVGATALTAWSQSAPVLTIAPTGTNQIAIGITNGINTGNYEVWWTPVLANPDYPWTAVAVGTNGETNFTLSVAGYQAGFFQVVQDTNLIPLWEAADPNNPGAGILTVYIDNPTNGAVLQ
jgi:hypothetical protein